MSNQSAQLNTKLGYLTRVNPDLPLLGFDNYKPDGLPRLWKLAEVDLNGNVRHYITEYMEFDTMAAYLQGRIDEAEHFLALMGRSS